MVTRRVDEVSCLSYLPGMTTHGDDEAAINRAIGSRVAWYMKYAGDRRTQAELGSILGMDQTSASKKLAGVRPFHLPELYAIAKWLERPVSDLLPSESELAAPPPLPALSPPRSRRRVSASAARDAAVKSKITRGDKRDSMTQRYWLSQNVVIDLAPITHAA